MSFLIKTLDGKLLCREISERMVSGREVKQASNHSVSEGDIYIVHNGRVITEDTAIELTPSATFHVVPRIPGGKGGFGSMLRAIGAQIEKTTNREACRDLSGRRMRDVNDEKKVTEWVAKQADREREDARKRAERLERRRSEPRHAFDDKNYSEKIRQNAERIGEALQQGLKTTGSVSSSSTSTNGKRKLDEPSTSTGKRSCMWLGLDNEDINEDDSDEDDAEQIHVEASPCPSSSTCSEPSLLRPACAASEAPSHPESYSLPDSSVTESSSKLPCQSSVACVSELTVSASHHDSPTSQPENNRTQASDAQASSSDSQAGSVAEATTSDETSVSSLLRCDEEEAMPGCSSSLSQDCTLNQVVDLEEFQTAKDLEALGLDRLKSALTALGLKCGGTLQQRAERLFLTKGLARDEIDSQLFAKNHKKIGKKKDK